MKPEDIKSWFARIQKAEDLQGDRAKERKEILKLYLGEFFGKPTDNSGEITEVNFVFEFIKVLIAAIYARDPFIFVRARSGKWAKFAETMELVINYYWSELKLKKKIKKSILDAVLSPPGFIELGYLFFKEKTDVQKELEEEFPELVTPKRPIEEMGIFDDTVKQDDVFANYRSSYNVLWPDGYNDIRECPYIFIRSKVPLLDVKTNPMFKSVKDRLTGFNTVTSSPKKPQLFRAQDPVKPLNASVRDGLDEEQIEITLYYVFDKRSQARFVLAKNFDEDTLFEKEWKYLPEGFSLFPLIFNEIPETEDKANSYPLSDVIPMLPQLKELSKISSAMMRHRKRSGTLLLTKKGAVAPQEITNIQNANDLDIVELENISEDSVRGFTPPSLPQDFYNLRKVILEDLMRVSGFQQLLARVPGVETATESENVRAGALLRTTEKQDIIEDFTVDIAIYLSGLIYQFKQDKREIAQIIGEDEVTEEMWPSLPKKADGTIDIGKARIFIQKEIFFKIEAGSTRPPKDEAVERKQWTELIAVIEATYPGRLKDSVILPQLLKKFDFKDIEQAVKGFDAEEAQAAQQESQLLLKGIAVPVSPNNNHKIHIQVHAQATQQGTTAELDQHLLSHVAFDEKMSPAQPQKGDARAATNSTAPDITRKGVGEGSDLSGAVSNLGSNKGPSLR
jgi:hypothetical protein